METVQNLRRFEEVIEILPYRLMTKLQNIPLQLKVNAQEIRLRAARPATLTVKGSNILIDTEPITQKEIETTLHIICESSIHTYQGNINDGFVTMKGGHRVGICGTAVINDGEITGVRYYSSLNIRIARQFIGCADSVMAIISKSKRLEGMLIASPPAGGKTTILRDLARQLSSGNRFKPLRVCVIDERDEIAAFYNGEPQNDVGIYTDVLSGYPKGKGMMRALRSLSPQVIICDEIGEEDDVDGVLSALNAGVPVIATAHAANIDELLKRPQISKLLGSGAIKKIIMLGGADNPGTVAGVWDANDGKYESIGDCSDNYSLGCDRVSFVAQAGKACCLA